MSKFVNIYHQKRTIFTTKDYVIKIEMVLDRTDEKVGIEFPESYKFRWMAFNIDNKDEFVRFDNHTGKLPHWHDNSKQGKLEWRGLELTEELFYQKVKEKFGDFDY